GMTKLQVYVDYQLAQFDHAGFTIGQLFKNIKAAAIKLGIKDDRAHMAVLRENGRHLFYDPLKGWILRASESDEELEAKEMKDSEVVESGSGMLASEGPEKMKYKAKNLEMQAALKTSLEIGRETSEAVNVGYGKLELS
ncbi:unnamed protein product, partial [Prorocentrum cordatum]